jgi:membrane-associated phospholipid phosphatase
MDRRIKRALTGAGIATVLLALTWVLGLHVRVFEHADQSIFRGFYDLHQRQRIDRLATFIADLCNPNPYVYLAAVPVAVALLRGRTRVLLAIATILLGANATTELLKPLLAHPRAADLLQGLSPVSPASWPSGHATAAMSLALCCVLAAPARLRPALATLGAAFAVAVSYSFLSLGWHFPSDVLGGFLIATIWTLLAIAGVYAADHRWPRRAPATRGDHVSVRDTLAPQAVLVAGSLAVAGIIALARPHQVLAYARGHEVFVLGAALIGLVALTLASAIMLATRR